MPDRHRRVDKSADITWLLESGQDSFAGLVVHLSPTLSYVVGSGFVRPDGLASIEDVTPELRRIWDEDAARSHELAGIRRRARTGPRDRRGRLYRS